jgi:hypothetical protein
MNTPPERHGLSWKRWSSEETCPRAEAAASLSQEILGSAQADSIFEIRVNWVMTTHCNPFETCSGLWTYAPCVARPRARLHCVSPFFKALMEGMYSRKLFYESVHPIEKMLDLIFPGIGMA